MNKAQPPPIASDVSPLRRWKWRSFALTVLQGGAILLFAYITLGFAPRYERIFEEMLGDLTRLPALAQWVISLSRFIQGSALILGPLLVFFPIILLWASRGHAGISLGVLLLIVVLVICSLAAIPALMIPHVQLIDSIGR